MIDDPNHDEYDCQEHGPSDMDYCPKCAEEGEEDRTCAKNPGSASGHSWVWDPPLPNSLELNGAPLAGTYRVACGLGCGWSKEVTLTGHEVWYG